MREAFRLGAQGYIHKLRAEFDLIPAIKAIVAGRRFVSSDLEFGQSIQAHRRHDVQFYLDDMVFLESVTRFISAALKADGAAIVLATSSHLESLAQRLKTQAFNIDGAMQQGTYIPLDAAEALAKIMVNGVPDHGRFVNALSNLIKSAVKSTKAEHPRVAVFGECVSLLYAEGNTNAAIQIEKTGNALLKTHDIDILCAYPLIPFRGAGDQVAFNSICAEHTAVFSW